MLWLLEMGLATWRLSRMLVKEDGPGHVFMRLRHATGIEYAPDGSLWSYPDWTPLHCVYCTTLYAGALLYLLPPWLRLLLAISGIAVLAEQTSKKLEVGSGG